jgi:hypothetical protein
MAGHCRRFFRGGYHKVFRYSQRFSISAQSMAAFTWEKPFAFRYLTNPFHRTGAGYHFSPVWQYAGTMILIIDLSPPDLIVHAQVSPLTGINVPNGA